MNNWRPESDWVMVTGKTRPRSHISWLLAVIVLIGAGLRLYHLGHVSLWHDEGLTFFYSSLPLEVLWTTPMGSHPPIYYSLIKAIGAFGQSEVTLRLISALAGAATIPVIYSIGKVFGGHGFGLVAAAALALSGIHIEYSQEARSYALAIFFLALACLYSLQFVTRRQQEATSKALRLELYLYGLFAGLAVITNVATIYYVFGLAAAVTLYCLASDPAFPRWHAVRVPWGYIATSLSVAVLTAGLLAWMAGAAGAFQWLNQYSWWSAMGIMTDVVGARHLDEIRTVSRLIMSTLCGVGALIFLQQRKYGPLGFVLLFVAVLPALIWLTGFIKPILMHRTVLPSVIGVALCIGALSLPRRRVISSSLLAAYFIPALLNLHAYYTDYEKEDWRGATNFLERQRTEGAATVLCGRDTYWLMRFYSDRKPGAVFGLALNAEDLLFELDEMRLRSIKSGKNNFPASIRPRDQQRLYASQWPNITNARSLFKTFDEIWVLDGHCFGGNAQRIMAEFQDRLKTAGFTPDERGEFYDVTATRYVRHGPPPTAQPALPR